MGNIQVVALQVTIWAWSTQIKCKATTKVAAWGSLRSRHVTAVISSKCNLLG